MDSKTREENIERMCAEGIEVASKLFAYLRTLVSNTEFNNLNRLEQKKYIKKHKPEFTQFIQLHPIVADYIISEKVFNNKAFRKYIRLVYGFERTREDQEYLARDPRNVYFFKNKQYVQYYKCLLLETNNHLGISEINKLCEAMIDTLNNQTQELLDSYERITNEQKVKEEIYTDEKKKELIQQLLQANKNSN